MNKKKKITIKERKLGRGGPTGKGYYGYAYPESGQIVIDPRQTSRGYLNTLIHEILHVLYPEDSEAKVLRNATIITKHIWEKKYRRIKN